VTGRRLLQRLRDEKGEGIISALLLLGGVLVPLLFLIALVGQVEQGRLAAAQAARAAVRAAVEAPSASAAETVAEQQLATEQSQTGTALQLQLIGSFERGSIIEADVRGQVQVGRLPLLGGLGTITVHAIARAPIDSYRSLPGVEP
jgi:hypothetical protein